MSTPQWIEEADGVFRGGGVKGLGLAGALLGFAEHPTKPVKKWVNVAGASAGAIIACYLATGHDGAELVDLMKQTQFTQFEDFPPGGELIGGGINLIRRHGLAHGEKFREWFGEQLDHKTFETVKVTKQNPDDPDDWYLKLIAVDVTNRALLVLPDDLARYREEADSPAIDPNAFEIANATRMSMSIPYFFEPVTLYRDRVYVEDVGGTDGLGVGLYDRLDVAKANAALASGDAAATFREPNEQEAKELESSIVDGGTLSNFPVWLFDARTGPMIRPTFGFTLTGGKGVGGGLNNLVSHAPWALQFGFDIFHSAMEAWDVRFVSNSTRTRTVAVDAGSVGTTQFNLTPELQQMLIDNGQAAAKRFLDRFDLSQYENTYHRGFTS
jgi:NTE family protein